MRATVVFPDSRTRTTPLGVGMATLMREPSPAAQQRLLHAAHEAGFRHFDVAPSYGLGAAESVLGRFLRTRPEGVTIGTKVGIRARANGRLVRLVQRPARALIRRFPGLRGRTTKAVGGVVHVPTDFSVASCQLSLEGSLRALGVEAIDLYLLHDAQPSDVSSGALLEWLAAVKQRGLVRNIGVATSPSAAASIIATHPGAFDAVQVPSHVLAPALGQLPPDAVPLRLTHGVLAIPLARVTGRIHTDPAWARELTRIVESDIEAPGAVPRLLLALGLRENPDGIVLVGASSERHLRSAPDAVGAFKPDRLAAAEVFIRSTITAD